MKIYVIGSTGFIGKNLVQFYRDQTVFEHKRDMDLIINLDLFNPDVIINCAAEIYKLDLMYDVNVVLVKTCLDWVKINRHVQFIQLGSSSEYGTLSRPSKESDPIVANTMYAGTKGAATLLCQTYANQFGLDIQIVRPYSPYGPGEQSHRLFPSLWRAFKITYSRPMILTMGVHDFCYIDDFVSAIDMIINSSKIRGSGEIINVSSGQQTTNLKILDIFRSVTSSHGTVNIDDKFTTPDVWCANIDHIKTKYGWRPQYSLVDGITKFLEQAKYE